MDWEINFKIRKIDCKIRKGKTKRF